MEAILFYVGYLLRHNKPFFAKIATILIEGIRPYALYHARAYQD